MPACAPERVLTAWPPIAAPHPSGGGAWCWLRDASGVVYAARDGALWRVLRSGGPAALLLAPTQGASLWSPCVADDGLMLAAVEVSDEWERVVVAPLAGERLPRSDGAEPLRRGDGEVLPPSGASTVASTADFVLDPSWTPDGRLLWHEWDDPDLPWMSSRIVQRTPDGRVTTLATGAVAQPRAALRWTLVPSRTVRGVTGGSSSGWIAESRGFREVHVDGEPVVVGSDGHEHADPPWGPGQRTWCWHPRGEAVAFDRNEGGYGRLCVAAVPAAGAEAVRELGKGVHSGLSWERAADGVERLAALRSGHRTPTQLVVYDPRSGARTIVAHSAPLAWDAVSTPEPEPVRWTSEGVEIPGRLYRPPAASRGLIVWVHGGPTAQSRVTWWPRAIALLSRGWSLLIPDHRGSTGWGREFREALDREWGVADVADVVAGAVAAREAGWSPNGTIVAMGGSAGGFTVLHALAASPEVFTAGIVLYPVTDLDQLDATTHRFERHYTRTLVGPVERNAERSPMQVVDAITAPLLVLHGDADKVVHVAQSQALADRLAELGRDVTLHVYEGEGHGWKRPETTVDEVERIDAFLARVAVPADGNLRG